jgi:hypothetical protein
MPSGLINIVTYGGQDLFLTGNPEITHFKSVYRRHTNFSSQSYKISFNDDINFGKEVHVEIPSIGDLLSKVYLELEIPEVGLRRITNSIYNQQVIIPAQNNYNTAQSSLIKVAKFMNLNMEAFRKVKEEYTPENSGEEALLTMKNIILNQFSLTSVGLSTSDVNKKIVEDFEELIVGNFEYELVSLYYLAENLDISGSNITAEEFYTNIELAIDMSYVLIKYYTNNYNQKKNILLDAQAPYYKFAWVDRLGHAIIDYIDVFIGGEKIDRHYGLWLDVWYELAGKKDQENTYMKMIGNIPELTTFDRTTKPNYKLIIPLQFWFCRHNGLAIPLVALEYNKVSFAIKIRDFSDISYVENVSSSNYYLNKPDLKIIYEDLGLKLNGYLCADYIFLDGPERRKFAQSGHEYLIEQVQYYYNSSINQELFTAKIDFNHPVKEIIWLVQKNSRLSNESGSYKIQWTNYGIEDNNKTNPIKQSKMVINSLDRIIALDGNYFNYVQPFNHHSNTPSDGINMYSFSLFPEEIQPSGSCNFTRIPSTIMTFTIDPRMAGITQDNSGNTISTDTFRLWIIGVNYNVLRIIGGFGALAFS